MVLPHPYDQIEGLDEREMFKPEGAGFDLRIGRLFTLTSSPAHIGIKDRRTPNTQSVRPYSDGYYIIEPGKLYLVQTVEKVKMDVDTVATVFPRSTMFRSGMALHTGVVNPGYVGTLTFSLVNHRGLENVRIEPQARIAHILFYKLQGDGQPYRGQWQGGRVSSPDTETQI